MGKGTPPLSAPAGADATADAPAPELGSVVGPCPNCGGKLSIDTDRQGYGTTLEQCENVVRCGYFRTLEKVKIAAHTRAPVKDELQRVSSRAIRTGTYGSLRAALDAALPSDEAEASDAKTILALVLRSRPTQSPVSVSVRLRQLARAGEIGARKDGAHATSPYRYWRLA